jgi:hypothetical protein
MITIKNGRARSERTADEIEAMLAQELGQLTPAERATFDLILEEMKGKKAVGGKSLLDVIGGAEYKTPPVDIRTFVQDPYYLGHTCDSVYPKLLDDLVELFEGGGYVEVILTGSIGWGKTFLASIGLCRILYEISCLKDPHSSFGLARDSNIAIVCFSINESLAAKVVYENIVTKIKASPYFQQHFPFEPTKKELRFPGNVWVAPRASTDTSALGLNTISAIIDECLLGSSQVLLADGQTRQLASLVGPDGFDVRTFDFPSDRTEVARAYAKQSTDQRSYELTMEDGSVLAGSWNHPVAIRERGGSLRFKMICDISPGDEVISYGEEGRKAAGVAKEVVERGGQEEDWGEECIFRQDTLTGNAGEDRSRASRDENASSFRRVAKEVIGGFEGEKQRQEEVDGVPDQSLYADEAVMGRGKDYRLDRDPRACESELRQDDIAGAQRGSFPSTTREQSFGRDQAHNVRKAPRKTNAYGGFQAAVVGAQSSSNGYFYSLRRGQAEDFAIQCLEQASRRLSIHRLGRDDQDGQGWVQEFLGASRNGDYELRRRNTELRLREAGRTARNSGRKKALDVARFRCDVQEPTTQKSGGSQTAWLCAGTQRDHEAQRRDRVLRGARLGLRDMGRVLSVVRVVSKRDLGMQPTYDVAVPGFEVFVANGILVHNTNFLAKRKTVIGEESRADTIYHAIKRRMKSRFEKQGKLPGMLFLVSSKKTDDDFTAQRIKESMNEATTFVRDYSIWDVKPAEDFKSKCFWVLCGNSETASRLLTDEEYEKYKDNVPEGSVLISVPEDFRHDFEADLDGAIKDIAGIAVVAVRPFIQRREKLREAIDPQLFHPFSTVIYDMSKGGRFIWEKMVALRTERGPGRLDYQRQRPIIDPTAARHIHIDIGLRKDRLGFVMAHVSGWKEVIRKGEDSREFSERAPVYTVDLALQVIPAIGGEVLLSEVRHLVYDLTDHGYMITTVTADQYQSAEMLQVFTSKGYRAQLISVDATPAPYDNLKSAIYEGRLRMYEYPVLMRELVHLQEDLTGNRRKIDHPSGESKDVSDALAGSLYTLSQLRLQQPLPILKSVQYAHDSWLEEQRHAQLAGDRQAGVNSNLLPAFLAGSGDDDGWESPWRPR